MDKQPSIQVPPAQYMSSSPKKPPFGLIIGLIVLILVVGGGATYYFLVYAKKSINVNPNVNIAVSNANNANKNINSISMANVNTDILVPCESESFTCTSLLAIEHQFQESQNNYVELSIFGLIDHTASVTDDMPPLLIDNKQVTNCLPEIDWINGEKYFWCAISTETYTEGSQVIVKLSFNNNTENVILKLPQISKTISGPENSIIYYPKGRSPEANSIINTYLSEKNPADSDKDGLPDTVESWFGLNNNKTDTDGDGYSDFEEVTKCNNPVGTGTMSQENYLTYCSSLLKDTGMSNTTEVCNEWKDTASIIIEANISKLNELDLTSEYNKYCPNTKNLLKNQNVIGSICSMIIMTATSICNPMRYSDLLPIKSST